MGRDHALTTFARTLAAFGLAAAISIGLAGPASAALSDRAGDEVVLKGSQVPGMIGTEPGKIVGFRWSGQWQQIPVQVDERHTIDARQLYPPQTTPPQVGSGYVGGNDPAFDIEVYADAKTRSGADSNPAFDEDDEFVFMAGDAGGDAPAGVAPPSGVDWQSGVKISVNDPVAGGSAAVYLFKTTGSLDPGAGVNYVDYDFKLTNLTEGQSLLDDYGYFHSTNPEDSTVTTDNYELHSYDRWMEDGLKVKAPGASQVNILDREVAQATLTGCGRSEYTFSGRWTEDSTPGNDGATDDEGTYVAVIDGPVRAIRSYMGANSGPYVQREHIYYGDHEQNTIFLRVHIMLDLYSWTDYSPAAIGMIYRDEKNPGGVTVDGMPDTLVPTTSADVANGSYSWQQLSGQQGAVSTVVGADTDIPNPNFGNYYLDEMNPGPDNIQCGGDGKSIGASGFGILGPITPNTDPRLGTFNNLTVKRTRYFGPPSDGAAEGAVYRDRVEKPLAGSASASPFGPTKGGPPGRGQRARLKVSFPGPRASARRGKVHRLRVRVANTGNAAARPVRVCVRSAALRRRGTCVRINAVPARAARTVVLRNRVKPYARGRKLRLNVSARSATNMAAANRRLVIGLRR